MANLIEYLYCEVWYHIEGLFEKSKSLRRPFTYIIRDLSYEHPVITIIICLLISVGLWFIMGWGFLLATIFGVLLAHFYWAKYKHGEQEYPEYIEED